MKRLAILLLLLTSAIASTVRAQGTDPNAVHSGAIGEVTAINRDAKQLTMKTDAGASLTVVFDDKTVFRRIPPGETQTSKAIRISFTDVAVGDRVYAQGAVAADGKTLPARQFLIMTKEDVTVLQERERLAWRNRGIVGVVSALNPETKEITVKLNAAGASRTITLTGAAEGIKYRRYEPDSIKFSDAKASSFEELKVGDVLRALGEKSADGTQFKPEQIVSGSFRTLGGVVTEVKPESGEIKINDIQTKQPLVIAVNADTQLRRMEAGQAATFGKPESAQATGADFQTVLEKQPALKISELKPGNLILISSTRGADPGRLTAITVVAGMDPLLKQFVDAKRKPTSVTVGLPVDIPLP